MLDDGQMRFIGLALVLVAPALVVACDKGKAAPESSVKETTAALAPGKCPDGATKNPQMEVCLKLPAGCKWKEGDTERIWCNSSGDTLTFSGILRASSGPDYESCLKDLKDASHGEGAWKGKGNVPIAEGDLAVGKGHWVTYKDKSDTFVSACAKGSKTFFSCEGDTSSSDKALESGVSICKSLYAL
jgi:hypothetical protein